MRLSNYAFSVPTSKSGSVGLVACSSLNRIETGVFFASGNDRGQNYTVSDPSVLSHLCECSTTVHTKYPLGLAAYSAERKQIDE